MDSNSQCSSRINYGSSWDSPSFLSKMHLGCSFSWSYSLFLSLFFSDPWICTSNSSFHTLTPNHSGHQVASRLNILYLPHHDAAHIGLAALFLVCILTRSEFLKIRTRVLLWIIVVSESAWALWRKKQKWLLNEWKFMLELCASYLWAGTSTFYRGIMGFDLGDCVWNWELRMSL